LVVFVDVKKGRSDALAYAERKRAEQHRENQHIE